MISNRDKNSLKLSILLYFLSNEKVINCLKQEKTGNNQAVVESLKKQEDELANKDKQIAALNEK